MEKLFKLKENGSSVRTELVAGLTTFMTMAYIIALNPNLLTGFGSQGGPQLRRRRGKHRFHHRHGLPRILPGRALHHPH